MNRFIETGIFVSILLISVTEIPASAKYAHPEKYYQKIDCKKKNGITEYPINGVRVDCLTDEYAIEYDFNNHKLYEGIVQSLYYAQLTGKKAGLVLIETGENDEVFTKRARDIIEFNKLPIKLEIIDK